MGPSIGLGQPQMAPYHLHDHDDLLRVCNFILPQLHLGTLREDRIRHVYVGWRPDQRKLNL